MELVGIALSLLTWGSAPHPARSLSPAPSPRRRARARLAVTCSHSPADRCRPRRARVAPISATPRQGHLHTHVRRRPTPRLGRLRGPLSPTPLPSQARTCAPLAVTCSHSPADRCHPRRARVAPISATRRQGHVHTHVGLRPTPRLGRLRGPLSPTPLPRRRARARLGRDLLALTGRPLSSPASPCSANLRDLTARSRPCSLGAPPHTPARSLAGTP